MLRKLWFIFAQAVTITLAAWLVIATMRPEWLPQAGRASPQKLNSIITLKESTKTGTPTHDSYAPAVQKAMPSVVNIFTRKARKQNQPLLDDLPLRRFFGEGDDAPAMSSLGSGVIVSEDGYLVTNHHVVETADEIEIALMDGRKVPAKIVGTDPETDLAVLKMNLHGLPTITFAASEDALKVGDVVLAIGNPFGVGQTVTMGIISALGRSHLGINTFENFIQTDAAINPGNSGGALVDASGNLIGINSAIYSKNGGSMGIGFAIPPTLVRQVMEQLIKNGAVTRGWIGVEVQDVTPQLAESFRLPTTQGALVAGVLRHGPADEAGIQPGDILVKIADKPVTDTVSMLTLIASLQPNHQAQLTIIRNQREMQVTATIGTRPKPRLNQ